MGAEWVGGESRCRAVQGGLGQSGLRTVQGRWGQSVQGGWGQSRCRAVQSWGDAEQL